MKKLNKLKSAITSFFPLKKLTSLAVSFATVFTMLPFASISAGAYTYTGLEEIGGKVLIQSSEEPLVLVDNGSNGKLDAYKFYINGEIGYCIDPQLPAQKTNGKTLEFTVFTGETGKEVIKLDPNSSDEKEKALIVGLSVLYGGYGDYFSTFKNGGKTAKSIMDGYINGVYSPFFKNMSNADDKYYFLSHYALSQLYHELIGDGSSWKTWSSYSDINTMVNGLVEFTKSIAKSTGDYSAILRSCETNNYYITQPKGKDGTFCQHLIVRIPKKAKLHLQKSGSSEEIKDLTSATQDKDYLNFAGAQYTLYNKSDNSVVGVAELDKNGNISKILYSYSNSEWITKSYFELEQGNYYLKETKAPANGYFALNNTEYQVTVTKDDCLNERTLDVLNVADTELVKLKLKKVSSNPEITDNNDCYDLDGATFTVFADKKSAYDYLADNSKKNNIVRYFLTDSNGDCKAISKDGNRWDYNANSDLYKISYSDTLYAVETVAPKGFKLYDEAVKLELSGTSGGYAVLSATITDEPKNDPIRVVLRKKNSVTGEYTNMANAEFTFCYYSGYYNTENELLNVSPERKWILKTDSDGYCRLDEEYRADSDYGEPFYFATTSGNPALPLGTLTIQETKAPAGYKINPELFIRQIKVDEATGSIMTFNEIEVLEEPDVVYGNLSILKSADDSKRSDNTAKDIWFNVKSDDGVTDELICTTAKGVDGIATLTNLAVYNSSNQLVKYTITELGYKNADGSYSIPDRYVAPVSKTVTLKENVTLTVSFTNRLQRTGLIVQKQSEDGIISGFYFSVVSDDGKTNKVLVTGEDGSVELTNLAVYNTSNEKVKYTIDELGFKNADGTYYFPDRYVKPAAQTVTLEDGKSITVKFYNSLKRGSVELNKIDGAGNPLEGIEFELYSTTSGIVRLVDVGGGIYEVADSSAENTITKLITDSDGGFLVNKLLPGDYYFLETNSKGYMPYGGKISFTISTDSNETLNVQLTVENNKAVMPNTGGTGNTHYIYTDIGIAILALTVLMTAVGLGIRKKKKLAVRKLDN